MNGVLPWVKTLQASSPLSVSSTDLQINIALDSKVFAPAGESYTKKESDAALHVDSALLLKAVKADVDSALLLKAVKADVDSALLLKAVKADVVKADVDSALLLKAVKADVDTALGTKQVAISAVSPLSLNTLGSLTLNSAGFAPAGEAYTKSQSDAALGKKQVAIKATLPLSLSALGDLTLNSTGFAAAGASYTKAESNGVYQQKFVAYQPLALTETTMSMGGVDLIVPTLILDMTGYATTDDISTLQSAISAISPLQLWPYGELSIDLGAYQAKLSVSAPLVLIGNTLSITLTSYVLASTLASTLANYLTAASLAPLCSL